MVPLIENLSGIKIEMYSREHLPVHIHVKYGEYETLLNIKTSEVMGGRLPSKKLRIVQDWLAEGDRRERLVNNFYQLNPRLAPPLIVAKPEDDIK